MFLDRIVTQTRADLDQRKREIPFEELQRRAALQGAARHGVRESEFPLVDRRLREEN